MSFAIDSFLPSTQKATQKAFKLTTSTADSHSKQSILISGATGRLSGRRYVHKLCDKNEIFCRIKSFEDKVNRQMFVDGRQWPSSPFKCRPSQCSKSHGYTQRIRSQKQQLPRWCIIIFGTLQIISSRWNWFLSPSFSVVTSWNQYFKLTLSTEVSVEIHTWMSDELSRRQKKWSPFPLDGEQRYDADADANIVDFLCQLQFS